MDGAVELLHGIRNAADVILVSVRKEHAADLVLVLDQISHVGDHKINAVHILVRESKTAVNDDDILPIFQNGHILTDLIQTAQGDDF